ncbi:MAG: hypothetical protein K2P86_12340 [Xanthobacteraceae bacterium]|jgi:hypothetical protein|nr:hypothetical protein [Xanthobacteraceae bacterium]
MSTSQTSKLEKPKNNKKISAADLAYVCERNRLRAYSAVIKEFKNSGIQQAELAVRLGREPAQINRWLSRAANWELDTYSLLLFGISGAFPKFEVMNPYEQATFTSFELTPPTTTDHYEYMPGNDNYASSLKQIRVL